MLFSGSQEVFMQPNGAGETPVSLEVTDRFATE